MRNVWENPTSSPAEEVPGDIDPLGGPIDEEVHAPTVEENTLPEQRESNIVENILEIPPASREHINIVRAKLENTLRDIEEYEEMVRMGREKMLAPLTWRIGDGITRVMEGLGYVNRYEHIPSTRQEYYTRPQQGYSAEEFSRLYYHHVYLPETIETALLANDESFREQVHVLAAKIKEHSLLNTLRSEHDDSDFEKWNSFLKQFRAIPREDRVRLTEYLLRPVKRVAHSVFTHVTGEAALEEILRDKSIKSPSLLAEMPQTGSHSSSTSATPLERSAVYFDHNSISLSYGQVEPGMLNRRLWFVSRGDVLLNRGLIVDRNSFERRHPFRPGRNLFGAAFISKDSIEGGVELPIEECFTVGIPEGADDLQKKIQEAFPGVSVFFYDPLYYYSAPSLEYFYPTPHQDKKKELSTDLVQDFSKRLRKKFGSVQVPDIVLSAVDLADNKQYWRFPQSIEVKEWPEDVPMRKAA